MSHIKNLDHENHFPQNIIPSKIISNFTSNYLRSFFQSHFPERIYVSYLNPNSEFSFPHFVVPMYASLIHTKVLEADSTYDYKQLNDLFEDIFFSNFNEKFLTLLIISFLVKKNPNFDQEKSNFLSNQLITQAHNVLIKTIPDIYPSIDVISNGVSRAKFDLEPLVLDIQELLNFPTEILHLPILDSIRSYLLSELDFRISIKILFRPLRFSFENGVFYSTFTTCLDSSTKLYLAHLHEVSSVIQLAGNIFHDPTICSEIASNLSLNTILYILTNLQADDLMSIKVDLVVFKQKMGKDKEWRIDK
jgi:hypothetical protein